MLRDHGQSQKYYHAMEGYNGRLDAIQAGILQVKLRHLTDWNGQRRACAQRYDSLLRDFDGVAAPVEAPHARSVYHLYVVQTDNRDSLQKFLAEKGISTGLHYPLPLHLQAAYQTLGYGPADFPVAENVSQRLLSLPMYAGLRPEQQDRVIEKIKTGLDLAGLTKV